ncbi:hypothetical protein OG689_37075 [Kitasatospora sp. NBC_00240]|uniref:hypothetical protein n=1 Tax=Kitasatospora sp. NBC_00240 TaxID=2903567 RepID=UPI0022510B0D|nr:hypothetical protein [Kitasatospora sp. NBC_00240]MCX5214809.1 hypothetical protein [Kitasatospora sp. NBC_00240]
METSRIDGEDEAGHRHSMRVTTGPAQVRHLVCDTCGHRRRVRAFAHDSAREHLAAEHGAGGFRTEYNGLGWLLGLVAFVVFLIVLAGYRR